MTTSLRLHYAPDNASLCVRLALEETVLTYATALVDRRTKAQHSADYLRLNPHGLIPVLETPSGPIFETAAILLWLGNMPGGETLLPPENTAEDAQTLSWLFSLSNGLHTSLRMLFYPQNYGDIAPDIAQHQCAAHLDKIEQAVATSKIFAPGTALACYLAPMLRWPALYPLNGHGWYDLPRWPALLAFAKSMDDRPATLRAAQAEGLGPKPFSAPIHPNPPEGSAL